MKNGNGNRNTNNIFAIFRCIIKCHDVPLPICLFFTEYRGDLKNASWKFEQENHRQSADFNQNEQLDANCFLKMKDFRHK